MKFWEYDEEIRGHIVTDCPLNCDGDGANGQTGQTACYVPRGSELSCLDLLENAGHPGNWWGLACDAGGRPFLQTRENNHPVSGAYISTTAYQWRFKKDGKTPRPVNDPDRYLDAAAVPFVVVPEAFVRGVPGAVLGCKCEVEYRGKVVGAMVGDTGPDFGEFSLFLCRKFDPEACCHGTGISRGVTIRIWPGTAFKGYPLQRL